MDDELLRALGRHQREDLDESPADEEVDGPWADLLTPFDDATREQLLDDVFDRVDASEPDAASEPAAASESPSDEPDHVAPVVDLSSRRRGVVLGVLFAAAAAVALGVWWTRGTPRESGTTVAVLPVYETSDLRGGPAGQRGPGDPVVESLSMSASDEIDWTVTPREPVSGPVAVALLAERDGSQPTLVRAPKAEIAPSGGVRVRGPLADIVALEPGDWTLSLLIAPPDALPGDAEQARSAGTPTWQRVSVRVTITDP